MFTGIVSNGFIADIIPNDQGWELIIEASTFASKVNLGDSVAIDGACLSVIKIEGPFLTFFVSFSSN